MTEGAFCEELTLEPAGSRDRAVIFDVDGTLCDVRDIRYLVDPTMPGFRGRKDYKAFHSASRFSRVNQKVAELLDRLIESDIRILIVSGRESRWLSMTQEWLARNHIRYDEIMFRADRDGRKDAIMKAEILAKLREKYHVLLAVDDSESVIEMWRANSVPVVVIGSDASVRPFSFDQSDVPATVWIALQKMQAK